MPFDSPSGGSLNTQGPDFDRIRGGDLLALDDGLTIIWKLLQQGLQSSARGLAALSVPQLIVPPFAASDFGILTLGTGGSWTPTAAQVPTLMGLRSLNWMTMIFETTGSPLAAASSDILALTIRIPGGAKVQYTTRTPIIVVNAGVPAIGSAEAEVDDDFILCFAGAYPTTAPAWTPTVFDTAAVAGQITIPVKY